MNCLKNSRSVLSLLLRRTPAASNPPPLRPRVYHTFRSPRDRPAQRSPQAPASRYPQRNDGITRWTGGGSGGSRWYKGKDKWVVKAAAVFLVGSGVVTAFYRSCDAVPFTNRTRLILLRPDAERWLGGLMFDDEKEELGSMVLSPLDPQSVRVRRIASEIFGAVDRGLATRHRLDAVKKDAAVMRGGSPQENRGKPRGTPHLDDWEVIVVKENMVNATCLPGGKIIVYTGLLNRFREDAEVATVLGHEVGHAVARHGAEKLTTRLSLLILQLVISLITNMSYDMLRIVRRYILDLPFSRRMEMEADHLGLMLLAAAGYDPRVAPSVYEKLGGGVGSEILNYISTHPSNKKRAQLLSQEHVMSEALAVYREVITARQGTEGVVKNKALKLYREIIAGRPRH